MEVARMSESDIFHVMVDASLCVYLSLHTWFCPFKFLQSRPSWTCSCTFFFKRSSFRQLILLHLYCPVCKLGAFAIDISFERFLIRLVSICPACLSAHLPSFKMPYQAKLLCPKSLAQTPWSHDPHHSIWRQLPAMSQGPRWLWTRKISTPSLENVLVIPIIPVVRNAKLVCLLPKYNRLRPRKRILSLKRNTKPQRPQRPQHRLKGRLSGMGKPRLRREKELPSELYLGKFLRCPGWTRKRKPKKIVLLRSTSMLDATSSLSSPWQMFLKHMKKVLLLRVFLPRPARPNSNSVQPMFVFILYIFGISHRANHIPSFPPPNLKFVTTLSHLMLCSPLPLPLPVSVLCLRKPLKVEPSLLRSENRSILHLLFPPPLPAAVAWANYHAPQVPLPPNSLNKCLDRSNSNGRFPTIHISFSRPMLYTHSRLATSHR